MADSPRIALVQDWLTGFAGGEQVLLALHKMYPEAPIYTSLYNPAKVPQFKDAKIIPSYLQKIPGILKKDKLAIPLMPAAFEAFDLKEFDTILSVGGGYAKGVITHPHQRHLAYCHTPIRYIWNLGGDNRNQGHWDSWLREREAHKMRLWDVVSAERVDQFIANSSTIQERVAKIYRMPSVVVHPPVEVERYAVSNESEGFYLTVGRLISYKYITIMIEACMQLKRHLKIVGTGPDEAKLKVLAGNSPYIQFLGRAPDAERDALYAKARGFILAAEEDFGMVPVEAMACGKPVLAYHRGGQRDYVVEGKTGIFFAEQTTESLIEGITRFEHISFNPTEIRHCAEKFTLAVFQEKMRALIEFQS